MSKRRSAAQLEHDRRLATLAAFIVDYEAERGVMTDDEMRQAHRWALEHAVPVRGPAR